MLPNPAWFICFRRSAPLFVAMLVYAGVSMPATAQDPHPVLISNATTASPIRHVIVILGENHTFDNIFATYKPLDGQRVWNLLSERIVKADGTPGANYKRAEQWRTEDSAADGYRISPDDRVPYAVLPAPLVGGLRKPYFRTLAEAKAAETGLPNDRYYAYLTTGGAERPAGTSGHADSKPAQSSSRSLSDHAWNSVRFLHRRSNPSLLSNVAGTGLQRLSRDRQ